MTAPISELRTAIYQALESDNALQTMLGGSKIYADVPASTSLPYIIIGQGASADQSARQVVVQEMELFLTIWSNQPGLAECEEIAFLVTQILSDTQLSLTSHNLIYLTIANQSTAKTTDTRLVQTVLRLRALIETGSSL